MFGLLLIPLLCLFYEKSTNAIIAYRDRANRWRTAGARERERIVREEAAWRTIGRLIGGSGLAVGALSVASTGLAVMWVLVGWRVVKPIRSELRDACLYRSTGSSDEPPYQW
jgi:hypothetical protein